jgi:hypothetical protein
VAQQLLPQRDLTLGSDSEQAHGVVPTKASL